MSRYKIPGINENHLVVVGYDKPMRTLFATVHDQEIEQRLDDDPDLDDDPLILWVGSNYDEIKIVEALKDQIAEYAIVPADIEQQLQADIEAGSGHVPSELQAWTERQILKLRSGEQ